MERKKKRKKKERKGRGFKLSYKRSKIVAREMIGIMRGHFYLYSQKEKTPAR